jgi:Xaa-Pro dipeptidase
MTNTQYLTQLERLIKSILKENINVPLKISDKTNIFYLTQIQREGILLITKEKSKQIKVIFYTKNTAIFDKIWTGHTFTPKEILTQVITPEIQNKLQSIPEITGITSEILIKQRMIKIQDEIQQIKKSIALTKKLFKLINPEQTPRENKARIDLFLTLAGANHAFEPIITRKGNILHDNTYANHNNGGALLVDMGAKYKYCADMTRTYPKTIQEKNICNAVKRVKERTIKQVKPQKTILELHEFASKQILEELQKLNIIQKNYSLEELFQNEVHKVFFPHGIGHHLGLEVHDVQLKIPLEKNMVITIEPGIYFNKELFENKSIKKFLNKQILKKYISVCGVRNEDTIIVT